EHAEGLGLVAAYILRRLVSAIAVMAMVGVFIFLLLFDRAATGKALCQALCAVISRLPMHFAPVKTPTSRLL
ncbi:hypothetical protein NKJ81_32290, partial [Mesorhizobium sp. M0018]|uniref:hypothetical protein n=1 Tax=Mesorhizobium sp. M0018 TaxID=2956844 RepID=UPI003334C39B